jgi:hypothetical protein
MTGESHSRPTQRMSRFSQAYRSMPAGAEPRASFDQPAESVLSRADDAATPGMRHAAAQRQRFAHAEPYADVIEVEFETVVSVPPAATQARETPATNGADAAHAAAYPEQGGGLQPPPPDIEAIAAALAAEMDRSAALHAKPVSEPKQEEPAPKPLDMTPSAPREDAIATPQDEAAKPRVESGAPAEIATIEPVAAAASEPSDTAAIAAPQASGDAAPLEASESAAAAPETPGVSPAPAIDEGPATIAAPESPQARAFAQVGRAAARISPLTKQGLHFARTKAGPAMIQAGFWLAQNLRRKEIRRRYGKALALTHGRLLDRRLEQHFFIPSLKAERFAPDPERGILYEGPVPATAFNWVMSALPQDLREYAFVDFRAGLGRAMLLASQRRFERIIGYEYTPAAYDDLQMNIAQFPRSKMLCRDVQCHRGDRTGVSIPDQPCVLYVANAWREDFLGNIMTYLGDSYRHKPRRLFLILENVDDKVALPKDDIFYRLDIPLAEKLKLGLLSPMDFQLYRTLV